MPLDEDVARLAKGKNLATVVTLMPGGQPQALLTWVDADDEHVLVNTEPQRQRARNVARPLRLGRGPRTRGRDRHRRRRPAAHRRTVAQVHRP